MLSHLTPAEEAWLRDQLQLVAVHGETETVIDDPDDDLAADADWVGPRFLRDAPDHDSEDSVQFDFEFGDDQPDRWGRHLWLYAEEDGEPGNVAWLVQKFLKTFRPDECWSLTFALTCSRPRPREFGGGAVFITADEMKWENVYSFTKKERAAFEAKTAGVQADPAEGPESDVAPPAAPAAGEWAPGTEGSPAGT
jgi:hypothetical protein